MVMPAPEDLMVRLENSQSTEERAAIRLINEAAFARQDEADLIDRLRADDCAILSLVAALQEKLVSHVMFRRMWIETSDLLIMAAALAPVAVLPEYQRQGIGGRLIREGLHILRDRKEKIVIVVGHADYYPRFGFLVEKARLLDAPFPRNVFMALDLSPHLLHGIRGKVVYPAAFGI
jgi:putative acetyltransferase